MATKQTDDWDVIPERGNASFVKFANIGDGATGAVVTYSPDSGMKDYNGNPCGFITLRDSDGELHQVELSKGNLIDAVADANPTKGLIMDIRFAELRTAKKSGRQFKAFRVRVKRGSGSGESATVAAPAASAPSSVTDDDDLEAPPF